MDGLRDSVGSIVGGGDDWRWAGSVEDLLYEGESVRETIDLDGNRIVVTSHRVLTFMPEDDGENFRDVTLPNVADVEADADGYSGLLVRGLKAFGLGVVLAIAGQFVELDGLVSGASIDGSTAGQVGIGGMFGMLNSFLRLLGRLDELMTMAGALLVIFATLLVAGYVLTRDRVLRIEVAGDEPDVQVGAPDEDAEAAVADLEIALFDDAPGDAAGAAGDRSLDRTAGRRGDRDGADAGFKSDGPL